MSSGDDRARADTEKRAAAERAAELVEQRMLVGLGTGSTVAHLLPALARRGLRIRCVATSPETADAARRLGLDVVPFSGRDRVDLAIDGADEVDPGCWLVKGGGGAHTREKVVAAASDRFVVIVSSDKLVDRLAPPVPVELLDFGADATLAAIGDASLRGGARSPDGGLLADYRGDVADPAALATRLDSIPGVVSHGLFPPALVGEVLVGALDPAGEATGTGAHVAVRRVVPVARAGGG
ncbi:MAG: ribose 5-phosphate isomerase A [Actinomycetota bacterium]|nr:ribose 5-phosphate isomerase A [Actinomycetota bacterium]